MPVPQNLVHVILGPDAQQLILLTFAFLFILAVAVGLVVMVVEALHVPADVLKVLLDAHLGKALGVLFAGIVEHLAFDINVMGPVLGLEEGGLGEARPDGSDQKGSEGHHE